MPGRHRATPLFTWAPHGFTVCLPTRGDREMRGGSYGDIPVYTDGSCRICVGLHPWTAHPASTDSSPTSCPSLTWPKATIDRPAVSLLASTPLEVRRGEDGIKPASEQCACPTACVPQHLPPSSAIAGAPLLDYHAGQCAMMRLPCLIDGPSDHFPCMQVQVTSSMS